MVWLLPDTEVINHDKKRVPQDHTLEMHNDIHNTDFCDVIECYIFDAW